MRLPSVDTPTYKYYLFKTMINVNTITYELADKIAAVFGHAGNMQAISTHVLALRCLFWPPSMVYLTLIVM